MRSIKAFVKVMPLDYRRVLRARRERSGRSHSGGTTRHASATSSEGDVEVSRG